MNRHISYKKFFISLLFGIIILLFAGCQDLFNGDAYEIAFSTNFRITSKPADNNPNNLAFVLQLPKYENNITKLWVKTFKVYQNNNLILEQNDFESTIDFNEWYDNDINGINYNYQAIYYCLPPGNNIFINEGDEISIVFECIANREILYPVKKFIIENTEAVGWWRNVGYEITAPEPIEQPGIPDPEPENPSEIKYIYNYSYNYLFEIKDRPSGNKIDNLRLVYQQDVSEGHETYYKITGLKVYYNNSLILNTSGHEDKIWYNQWTNNDGTTSSNYMTLVDILPSTFNQQINLKDKIKIEISLKTNRPIKNNLRPSLIDNSRAVNYWKDVGEVIHDYPQESIPNEKIIYNNTTYKLVFNEDFNKDYSDLNPLKNGIYKQAMNLNNWWAEDWGSYADVNDGCQNRTIRDFKIQNGIAEFPMIRKGNCNSGPSIMTCIWDPKGINSVPIYEFNKGIFEIKFKAPVGSEYPGQFTFWVLNYNTNFENSPFPTNPYKASDGFALDEIDFFEYSPSRKLIRTGTRSCNGINSRPGAGYQQVYVPDNFGDSFHVFRCVWDESGLKSYLDGSLISTVSASSIKGFNNPNDRFMLLVSSQSIRESGLGGNVYQDFNPYSYYVDYVKVYEKE